MSEKLDNFSNDSVEKKHQDVIDSIGENFGEELEILRARGGEFALRADGIERLVLDIRGKLLRIKDIESSNQGSGEGTHMIEALIATAEELGYELWAENVRPEYDSWWRERGFAPPAEDKHSADYVYNGAES